MKNANLPAMPQLRINPWKELSVNGGLTKREYFAGLAMQGILASLTGDDCISPNDLARCSLVNADALLAELERQQTKVGE